MDWSQFIEYAGFALTVLGGLYALNKNMQTQFSDLKDTQQQNHHETDIRLTRIDSTVSPYAQDIMNLKDNQQKNMIELTELKSWSNRIEKLERQVETLQKNHR